MHDFKSWPGVYLTLNKKTMKTLKITPGKWRQMSSLVYASPDGMSGTPLIGNCRGNVKLIPKEQSVANAQLIAEAGTVANETGLTPRQLLEQRNELLLAVKRMIRIKPLIEHPNDTKDEHKGGGGSCGHCPSRTGHQKHHDMNVPLGADTDPRAPWNIDTPEHRIEDVELLPDGLKITFGNQTKTLDFDRLRSYDNYQHFYGDWTVNRMAYTDEEITLHCIGERWQGFKIVVGWDEIDKLFN